MRITTRRLLTDLDLEKAVRPRHERTEDLQAQRKEEKNGGDKVKGADGTQVPEMARYFTRVAVEKAGSVCPPSPKHPHDHGSRRGRGERHPKNDSPALGKHDERAAGNKLILSFLRWESTHFFSFSVDNESLL